MHKIAQKGDWKTEPMPAQNAKFQLKREFTKEQMAALMKGNIPQEMEDKWFWYYEDGKLYAHRSWTGFCIYIIEFNMATGMHDVTVNRNPEQYKCTDIGEDTDSLNHLLDWWTQPQYDYYHEWLSETVNNLMKQTAPQTTLTIDSQWAGVSHCYLPGSENSPMVSPWCHLESGKIQAGGAASGAKSADTPRTF